MSKSPALAVIDIQNLFLSSRAEYGSLARVDYVALKTRIEECFDPGTEINYVAYVLVSPYHEDYKFVKFLKNRGFKVMRHYVQNQSAPNALSNANVQYSSRMLKESLGLLSSHLGDLVIVSGNGHFSSLINAAKADGRKVTLFAFKSATQQDAAKLADAVIFMDNTFLYNENLYKGKRNGKTPEVSNISDNMG